MERRPQFRRGIAIGEGIGALLAVALVACLSLGLELFSMGVQTLFGAAVIGGILGGILGWLFSRPRPTLEGVMGVMGVPRPKQIRILMWVPIMGAVAIAFSAQVEGELLKAMAFLALAVGWTLQASRVVERARALLYLSGYIFLLGLLLIGTALLLGEFG
jgi:hypothetical protein